VYTHWLVANSSANIVTIIIIIVHG